MIISQSVMSIFVRMCEMPGSYYNIHERLKIRKAIRINKKNRVLYGT